MLSDGEVGCLLGHVVCLAVLSSALLTLGVTSVIHKVIESLTPGPVDVVVCCLTCDFPASSSLFSASDKADLFDPPSSSFVTPGTVLIVSHPGDSFMIDNPPSYQPCFRERAGMYNAEKQNKENSSGFFGGRCTKSVTSYILDLISGTSGHRAIFISQCRIHESMRQDISQETIVVLFSPSCSSAMQVIRLRKIAQAFFAEALRPASISAGSPRALRFQPNERTKSDFYPCEYGQTSIRRKGIGKYAGWTMLGIF